MPRSKQKQADRALLQALACGASVENAARKVGISERTAYRRLATPEFSKQLTQCRLEMVQRTARMLTGAGMNSVKTLVDLQQDVSVHAGVRRRAAKDVLEMGMKFRADGDGEQCLTEQVDHEPPRCLQTLEDVLALIEEQVEAIRAEPSVATVQKARTIAQLTRIAAKAIESGKIAARLEMLEMVLKNRAEGPKP